MTDQIDVPREFAPNKDPRSYTLLALSAFIPKGLKIINMGRGWLPYSEALEATLVDSDSEDGDLISLLGCEAFTKDPLGTLRALSGRKVPILCGFVGALGPMYDAKEAEGGLDAPSRSVSEIDDLIKESSLTLAVRQAMPLALVCLLLPAGSMPGRWWSTEEYRRVMKRQMKRGEKQIQRELERMVNPDLAFGSEAWRKRAEVACSLFPRGSAIMDIGCGGMFIEEIAQPRHYVPIDIEARDGRTRILDLNKQEIPAEWFSEVEIVVCMGVFEYINSTSDILKKARDSNNTVICSYNVLDFRLPDHDYRINRWENGYTTSEMENLFSSNGYRIEEKIRYNAKQFIWHLKPETSIQ